MYFASSVERLSFRPYAPDDEMRPCYMQSPGHNSRHKGVEKGRIDGIVTAVEGEIRRFDAVVYERMYPAFDGSVGGDVVHENRGLIAIALGDRIDRRVVQVSRGAVFELDDGVGPLKVLRRGFDANVEDDGGDIRRNGLVGIRGGVVHICQDAWGAAAARFVEEYAVDCDVVWLIASPFSVDANVVDEF